MMSPGDEDPFLQVQDDVQTALLQTRSLFSSYLRILSLTTSPTSPELLAARTDLTTALSDLKEDISDLSAAIRAIERDPSAFNLDGIEVGRRKRLVQDITGEVEDMDEELARNIAAASGGASTGQQPSSPFPGGRQGSARDLPDPSSFPDGDSRGSPPQDYAAEFEEQTQAQIMREQDTQLDSVYVTVGNLRNMASDMGRELNEQSEMLGAVDGLADRVGGRLATGMDKMKHVIRKNEDGLSSCCIAVLIVVLIIVLVLLLVL